MKDDYLRELDEKCQLLHKSTLLELSIYNESARQLFQYRFQEIPVFLMNYVQNSIKVFLDHHKPYAKDTIHYFTNEIMMTFLCIFLYDGERFKGVVVVGPYLAEDKDSIDTSIKKIVKIVGLPKDSVAFLTNYYQSIPIFQERQKAYIGRLILNIMNISLIKSVEIEAPLEESGLLELVKEWHFDETIESFEAYRTFENKLLYAIECGNAKVALNLLDHRDFNIANIMYINNSLRNAKNILIVANTIYLRAANRGGVSLAFGDSLSGKFFALIEYARTMKDLQRLSKKMIIDYCECVNTFKIEHYSPIIQQVIDYIQQNIKEKITLQSIAEHFKMNKTYLSRIFRDAVGLTLTEFIQKDRIKVACYLLDHDHFTVTKVASLVGYDDPNYFTKIFKKNTGVTPTKYLPNKNTHY